jgi:hypothetical protein
MWWGCSRSCWTLRLAELEYSLISALRKSAITKWVKFILVYKEPILVHALRPPKTARNQASLDTQVVDATVAYCLVEDGVVLARNSESEQRAAYHDSRSSRQPLIWNKDMDLALKRAMDQRKTARKSESLWNYSRGIRLHELEKWCLFLTCV